MALYPRSESQAFDANTAEEICRNYHRLQGLERALMANDHLRCTDGRTALTLASKLNETTEPGKMFVPDHMGNIYCLTSTSPRTQTDEEQGIFIKTDYANTSREVGYGTGEVIMWDKRKKETIKIYTDVLRNKLKVGHAFPGIDHRHKKMKNIGSAQEHGGE
ncbi:MAG: hypothetical protein ABIJ21_02480 [Nanoarchaeota archaeon]